ncbi:MAG: hypothetical protein M3Z96_05500 [Pseudomonadota bacterium]|nr:hypothetical protein [Pseudomonadota bacterium]
MAQLTSAGRRPLWIALLVVASVVFSLGFACAVPLAAFAAIAALTLSRRDAFALVGAIWLANQIAGFAVHHYPVTASTLAWGARLGAVALLSTLAAQWVKDHLAQSHMAAAAAAFLAVFAMYEGSLFAISLALASGVSNYTPSIVWRIFAINAAAFAALFLVHRLGVFGGLGPRPPFPRANAGLDARPMRNLESASKTWPSS